MYCQQFAYRHSMCSILKKLQSNRSYFLKWQKLCSHICLPNKQEVSILSADWQRKSTQLITKEFKTEERVSNKSEDSCLLTYKRKVTCLWWTYHRIQPVKTSVFRTHSHLHFATSSTEWYTHSVIWQNTLHSKSTHL